MSPQHQSGLGHGVARAPARVVGLTLGRGHRGRSRGVAWLGGLGIGLQALLVRWRRCPYSWLAVIMSAEDMSPLDPLRHPERRNGAPRAGCRTKAVSGSLPPGSSCRRATPPGPRPNVGRHRRRGGVRRVRATRDVDRDGVRDPVRSSEQPTGSIQPTYPMLRGVGDGADQAPVGHAVALS